MENQKLICEYKDCTVGLYEAKEDGLIYAKPVVNFVIDGKRICRVGVFDVESATIRLYIVPPLEFDDRYGELIEERSHVNLQIYEYDWRDFS